MKLIDAYARILAQMEQVVVLLRDTAELMGDERLRPESREAAEIEYRRMRITFQELTALAQQLLAQAGVDSSLPPDAAPDDERYGYRHSHE